MTASSNRSTGPSSDREALTMRSNSVAGARTAQRQKVLGLMQKAQKKSKYRAVRCEVDGITFDSKAEARRWSELRLLEKNKEIRNLERQVPFRLEVLTPNETTTELIGIYRADFSYTRRTSAGVENIVEDVKGKDTALSVWKRKHVKQQYGIDVQIVK